MKTETAVKRHGRIGRSDKFPYLLIAPSLLMLSVFIFYPMFRGLLYSFQDYQRNRPAQRGWIGLNNFTALLSDDRFYSSFLLSFQWVFWQVCLQLLMGLIFALILNANFRFRGFVRTICFAPWAVSGVLTTMLWILIYNEHIGFLNLFLRTIGLGSIARAWVQNIDSVFPAIIIAQLWRGIPFFAITLLASLQSIPGEMYESARVDGASSVQTLFRITLPFLKESIIFATIMRIIWEFQSVDMILTMTNGGPMRRTTTLPIYMFQRSIIEGNYGYGSSIAMAGFVFLSVFAFLYLKANNFGRGVYE